MVNEEKPPISPPSAEEGGNDIGKSTNLDSSTDIAQIVKTAKEAAEELKKQNEIKRELLQKEEEILARREALKALGGDSTAGQKPEKKIETPREYAERLLRGGI